MTPVPAADIKRGDGPLYVDFTQAVCRVTKDSVAAAAGELLRIRPWQDQLFGHLLARRPDGRLRHREALIGVARKNGKSGVGAPIALTSLVTGPEGGEVYSCAADRKQAGVVFDIARQMVQRDPELNALLKVYRDVIEFPKTGSIYRALSAEAFTKEGLNPHLVLFDEVHAQPNRELWDVMALAMGARVEPLMVGITTAGVRTDSTGQDSLCYTMYQHGIRVINGEVEDPSFFMAWWEPWNPGADHRDPQTWREANPGFGDLVSAEDFASKLLRTPEPEFRTKRCNQWVNSVNGWFPAGAWECLADLDREIPDGTDVVVAFDGSVSGDSTVIVVVTVEQNPHIHLLTAWEKPSDVLDWRVPRGEVREALRDACRRWNVREIAWDEFLWLDTAEELEDEGLPVVTFPQQISSMGPATQRFYEAVMDAAITHDGDPVLARHIGNATLKTDSRGSRITKDHRGSARKIDAAVGAVMGLHRAAELFGQDDGVILW